MLAKYLAGDEKCMSCGKPFKDGDTVFVFYKKNKDGSTYTLIQHEYGC